MELSYCTIEQMLKMIDGQNGGICLKIYRDNMELFRKVHGSTNNHQAWSGGYHDHIQEAMNWGVLLYHAIGMARQLPFSLSDLLLVVFLHDIEKPWKYILDAKGQLRHRKSLNSKDAQHKFRNKKLKEYGIILSVEQENAMKYAEGELDDYTNRRRMMNELAGLCHICDVMSARVFHNYPRQETASWGGARRIRD